MRADVCEMIGLIKDGPKYENSKEGIRKASYRKVPGD